MRWEELEAAAPELARLGRERFDAVGIALLGTVRMGGWPRISPIAPFFARGELVVGVMRSGKARDLRRDPRCTLQSAVTSPDPSDGELKLYGRAVLVDEELRAGVPDGWWLEWPRGDADVYRLEIEEALFLEWHLPGGRVTLHRWSPGAGTTKTSRAYP